MKHLVLSADYLHYSLRDQEPDGDDPYVPSDLRMRLVEWNKRYQAVIPMEPQERATRAVQNLIDTLDRDGLQLAEDVKRTVPDVHEVDYYSEGLLRIVVPDGK